MDIELSDEDAKLVTLARGARARVGADSGAALRDETGRSYSAVSVILPSFAISALQLAVAQAVAGGAQGCECAVVVTSDGGVQPQDLAAAHDLGGESVRVLGVHYDGTIDVDVSAGTP